MPCVPSSQGDGATTDVKPRLFVEPVDEHIGFLYWSTPFGHVRKLLAMCATSGAQIVATPGRIHPTQVAAEHRKLLLSPSQNRRQCPQ